VPYCSLMTTSSYNETYHNQHSFHKSWQNAAGRQTKLKIARIRFRAYSFLQHLLTSDYSSASKVATVRPRQNRDGDGRLQMIETHWDWKVLCWRRRGRQFRIPFVVMLYNKHRGARTTGPVDAAALPLTYGPHGGGRGQKTAFYGNTWLVCPSHRMIKEHHVLRECRSSISFLLF